MMQALEGLLVLDLSRRYPGAYSAMFLGDFGAEVIKVDPPGTVLPSPKYQGGEPVDVDTASEKFAAHFPLDRNKKSITLNLKEERGKEVLRRLAKEADVIIEGFRPGVMDRLGVGYETLKELNPRLIYCAESAFGVDGPYAQRPAHDHNLIGIAGLLSLIGPKGGKPCLPSNFLGDLGGAGLHGAIGVLLAILARERTGKGQFVDISYLDTAVSLLAYDSAYYFMTEKVPRRGETYNSGGAPWCNVYECKDREYIVLSCAEPHLWANLCRLLGREDLVPHQESKEAQWAIAELGKIFATKTRQEWEDTLQNENVCFAPVNYLNETFVDPQVLHRGMVMEVEHPKLGTVKQIGIPIKLSDTPGTIRSLGITLGANTDEILARFGYTPDEVASLRKEEVTG